MKASLIIFRFLSLALANSLILSPVSSQASPGPDASPLERARIESMLLHSGDPPASAQELVDRLVTKHPGQISESLLKKKSDEFARQVRFLGEPLETREAHLSLLEQWTYLELFIKHKKEYLIYSFARTLLLSRLPVEMAIQKFDLLFPERWAENSPRLKATRDQVRNQLLVEFSNSDRRELLRQELRTHLASALKLNYVLDRLEEELLKRHKKFSEHAKARRKEIKGWRSGILSAFPILNTPSFKKIKRKSKAILEQDFALTEEAVYQFRRPFHEFFQNQTDLSHFAKLLSNSEIQDLIQTVMTHPERKGMSELQELVAEALPAGVAKVLRSTEKEIFRFDEKVIQYDYSEKVITSNLYPKKHDGSYYRWLEKIFKQQAVHWALTEEFPYFGKAVEHLTGLVSKEISRRNKISAGVVFGFTALQLAMARHLRDHPSMNHKHYLYMGVNAVLAGVYGSQSAISIINYRTMKTMSMTSIDGGSLIEGFQVESALRSVQLHSFILTMMGGVLSAHVISKFQSLSTGVMPKAGDKALETVLKLPGRIADSMFIAIMIGLADTTFQHVINAKAVETFVGAYEAMNWKIPVYWRMNSLNWNYKSDRDALITSYEDMSYMISEISSNLGRITLYTAMIESGEYSPEQEENLRAAIDGLQQSNRNFLCLQTSKWFYFPEYRDKANSIMKEIGIGLDFAPTIKDPKSITMTIKVGDQELSCTRTARKLEDLNQRIVLPKVQLSN